MIVEVNVNPKYICTIERGSLSKASTLFNLKRKVLIITDSNIPKKYIESLFKQIEEPFVYTIKAGEASKSIISFASIMSYLIKNNFSRGDAIVALGGGVTGDLSGFIASTYMRGIDFYNIPTSLLSMVDSSIGGKCAIDYDGIKNIVGSFYQPKAVIIDPDLLKSLPKRELYSGLVESIKMAINFDKDLFNLIKNSTNLDDDIEEIIYRSLKIKADVVEKDTYESSLRSVLNFGHTIGHAIESYYAPNLLHGEAVALGMIYFTYGPLKDELISVLKKYNLSTTASFDKEKILSYISHDKKASGKKIKVICAKELGTYEINYMSLDEIGGLL